MHAHRHENQTQREIAWSYKKNRAGSKKSKAYLSPKTAARHLRRLLKRRRKLEATDRLLCITIEQLKERLSNFEKKLSERGG